MGLPTLFLRFKAPHGIIPFMKCLTTALLLVAAGDSAVKVPFGKGRAKNGGKSIWNE